MFSIKRRLQFALAIGGLAHCIAASALTPANPAPLPKNLSFMAQDASATWALYRVTDQGKAVRFPTQLEPRHACFSARDQTAVYIAANGSLRLAKLDGSPEVVLAVDDAKRSFTQPCLSEDGREVVAVEMMEGKSVETEIVRFDVNQPVQTHKDKPYTRIARQPGGQHDPFIHQGRWLTYASVNCSDGCDRLLVEIWLRDLIGGTARQLSLLNAMSQAPVTDGKKVVFSSNPAGVFQLWQINADGSGLQALTDTKTNALHPALCAGGLYFVQSTPSGAVLMKRNADGSTLAFKVPGLQSFRGLRCIEE
jgi:hypothetical protein